MTATCWKCKTEPAGNDYAGPYSAYCPGCQPIDIRPQPRASQCACGACGRIFAAMGDFDAHQERHPRGHEREGAFTGRCLDPASIGLEMAAGVWGSPAGNAKRARLAAGMATVRGARLRVQSQTAEQATVHIPARAEPSARLVSTERGQTGSAA